MVETANSENTVTLEMKPEVQGAEYDAYGNIRAIDSSSIDAGLTVTPKSSVPTSSIYTAPYVAKSQVQPALDKKIVVFDMETTGTDPWDYRMLGGSFWELDKPVSTMESFFSFDEEQLTKDIAAYLNDKKPAILICFNNGFDQRCLLTRFMLYQTPVPGWNAIEQVDMMEVLKKGTTQSIYSSQATGSEEIWLKYFYNESKPYNIDQCFEGVRNGDLRPMTIRNRTCVEGVGFMYLLFRAVTDTEVLTVNQDKPTALNIDEAEAKGVCLVQCPSCEAINNVPCTSTNNKCWRCLGYIPDPNGNNIIKEVVRQYDFTKVGLKAKTE